MPNPVRRREAKGLPGLHTECGIPGINVAHGGHSVPQIGSVPAACPAKTGPDVMSDFRLIGEGKREKGNSQLDKSLPGRGTPIQSLRKHPGTIFRNGFTHTSDRSIVRPVPESECILFLIFRKKGVLGNNIG